MKGIRRKNRALTPGSGYVNVCSLTGAPVWRLEKTEAFGNDYRHADGALMPAADWQRISATAFPGCDVFSIKTMANSAGYSDWRAFERAITRAGSAMHLVTQGPAYAPVV